MPQFCAKSLVPHMLVHDPSNLKNLVVSRVYGLAQNWKKEHFWANLVQMNNVIDISWCTVGDFNELETQAEKRGTFGLH